MFDFEGETDDGEPRPRYGRTAAATGKFLAMIGLALVALVAIAFTAVWLLQAVRD